MNSPDTNARRVPPSFGILVLGNDRRDEQDLGDRRSYRCAAEDFPSRSKVLLTRRRTCIINTAKLLLAEDAKDDNN